MYRSSQPEKGGVCIVVFSVSLQALPTVFRLNVVTVPKDLTRCAVRASSVKSTRMYRTLTRECSIYGQTAQFMAVGASSVYGQTAQTYCIHCRGC